MPDAELVPLSTLVGLAVGAAGFALGLWVLRALARLRVPWWPAAVAPSLAFGPAFGLLAAAFVHGGFDLSALAFWAEGSSTGVKTAWSLLLFFGATGAYGVVHAFLSSSLVAEGLGVRIPGVFLDVGRIAVWVVMTFAVVGLVWHRTDLFSTLFAASAVGTLVLGLALQDTIKNFIAAWFIVGEGSYAPGDWVWIGATEGEVVSVTRRATKVQTRSGDVVTIPNFVVVAGLVRNLSRPTPAHAENLYVQASYDAPPNRVRDALARAVRAVPRILAEPPPRFRVHRFADSGVEYEVKVWLRDMPNLWDVRSDLNAQIWYQFRREGISFPYPVVDLRPRRTAHEPLAGPSGEAVQRRLRSVPFFQALPDDLLVALARDAGLAAYGAGERIVQRGEPGEACYVVDEGRLAVVLSEGGAEREVAVLRPGDLFGEMSLLTGEPRSATVRAQEDARLVVVGSTALRAALERSPELSERLAEVVALRKEGLLEARVALDHAAKARVEQHQRHLGALIRQFFRIGGAAAEAPPAGGAGGVAGRDPRP